MMPLEQAAGTPEQSGNYLARLSGGGQWVVAYWSRHDARWSFLSRPIGVAVYFTPALPDKGMA
jgi:hypothetical protein